MRKNVNRLRSVREYRGLQQADVANDINIGRSSLSGYEKSTFPPMEPTVRLAEYYHVGLDYIMGFTDEIEPEKGSLAELFHDVAACTPGIAINSSDIGNLIKAFIMYYKAGAPCGDITMESLRGYISALTSALLCASTNRHNELLDAVNIAIASALNVAKMPMIILQSDGKEHKNGTPE